MTLSNSIGGLTNEQNRLVTELSTRLASNGQDAVAQRIQQQLQDLNDRIEAAKSLKRGSEYNLQRNIEDTPGWANVFMRGTRRMMLRERDGLNNLIGSLGARINTLEEQRREIIQTLERANNESLPAGERRAALTRAGVLLGQDFRIGQDVFTRARSAGMDGRTEAPPTPPIISAPQLPPTPQLPVNVPEDIKTAFDELNGRIVAARSLSGGTQRNLTSNANDSGVEIVFTRSAVQRERDGLQSLSGGVETRAGELERLRTQVATILCEGQRPGQTMEERYEAVRILLGQNQRIGQSVFNGAQDAGLRESGQLFTEAVQNATTLVEVVETLQDAPGHAAYGVTFAMTGGNQTAANAARRGINTINRAGQLAGNLMYGDMSSEQALDRFGRQVVREAVGFGTDLIPGGPLGIGNVAGNTIQNLTDQVLDGRELDVRAAVESGVTDVITERLAGAGGNLVRNSVVSRLGRGAPSTLTNRIGNLASLGTTQLVRRQIGSGVESAVHQAGEYVVNSGEEVTQFVANNILSTENGAVVQANIPLSVSELPVITQRISPATSEGVQLPTNETVVPLTNPQIATTIQANNIGGIFSTLSESSVSEYQSLVVLGGQGDLEQNFSGNLERLIIGAPFVTGEESKASTKELLDFFKRNLLVSSVDISHYLTLLNANDKQTEPMRSKIYIPRPVRKLQQPILLAQPNLVNYKKLNQPKDFNTLA